MTFNRFIDSKNKVEVASTNSFISSEVKKSNISTQKFADSSKTFSSISQAVKEKKVKDHFTAVP